MKSLLTIIAVLIATTLAQQLVADDGAFFESEIRPLFIEHCYECHSQEAESVDANLYLDNKAGWMSGGDNGPVIIPGEPEKSRLFQAITHSHGLEPMPPETALSKIQIANIRTWIARGAYDPREGEPGKKEESKAFDIEERKDWWSYKPIQYIAPTVEDTDNWCINEIDQYILSTLQKEKLTPASRGEKSTLLRRAAFTLTGLPPTIEAQQKFLIEQSDQPWATVWSNIIDHYLAHQGYGEHWARHWMDLCGYAESRGHEADHGFPGSWRYRDYLIRAFNTDVPYDQFLKEQIAGDLISPPRLNKDDKRNESVMGPGGLNLSSRVHGPTDIKAEEIISVNSQIDYVSKAFLGQSLACARCHDHKFDALTTKDFYSWYGIFSSSRYGYVNVNNPTKQASLYKQLEKIAGIMTSKLQKHIEAPTGDYGDMLKGAVTFLQANPKYKNLKEKKKKDEAIKKYCDTHQLDINDLTPWVKYLVTKGVPDFLETTDVALGQKRLNNVKKLINEYKIKGDIVADFTQRPSKWQADGQSFLIPPKNLYQPVYSSEKKNGIIRFNQTYLVSGRHSSQFAGVLRSDTFVLDKKFIHFYARGRESSVKVVINNFQLTSIGPLTVTEKSINKDQFEWHTINLNRHLGHRGYIEVLHHGPQLAHKGASATETPADDAWIEVGKIVLSNIDKQPVIYPGWIGALSYENVYEDFSRQITEAIIAFKEDNLNNTQAVMLDGLLQHGLLSLTHDDKAFTKSAQKYHQAVEKVPDVRYALTLTDGNGQDEAVFVRGNHKSPSKDQEGHVKYVSRRFLEALDSNPFEGEGSGRLALAKQMLTDDNPLTKRVIVNRLWHHLFGRGIVPTVDSFGRLGEQPTHPELLDALAIDFGKNGWSMKKMIKQMMTSATYQMNSNKTEQAMMQDPTNHYWHHMPPKRITAESIRDSMLLVSNQLDDKLYGASIPVHLTNFMDGRGKPEKSGPLNGKNRRSIYTKVNRNFLDPFMLVFNRPQPSNPFGRRNVTNVPAQSLMLLNSPLINELAGHWAETIAKETTPYETRIKRIYQQAYGRIPTEKELDVNLEMLAAFKSKSDKQMWQSLCHAHFNTKEFIYLQ